MLVLSRRSGEKITVRTASGEEVVITITDIDRNKVRIGIDAPRNFSIMRNELLPQNQQGEKQS